MKKSIIEVIKSNKEVIVKKSLVIGGTIAGLFIVGALLTSNDVEEVDGNQEGLDLDGDKVIEVEFTEESN